jgi:ABC-type sugar transport system ATPase subunit
MISLVQVSIAQGAFALRNISLEVPTGLYGVLMGRTGCGKTTLLEAICGLRRLGSGTVRLLGRDVTALRPADRGIGYVPQDLALFSTLTVRDHLAFALVVRRYRSREVDARVTELAELLGIEDLLDRKSQGLSGGEAQRVALGRALAMRPQVLLFDEPLSALDDDTRQEMYELLQSVRRAVRVTVLHVTHNRDEASRLGDCFFELRDGRVSEISSDKVLLPPGSNRDAGE